MSDTFLQRCLVFCNPLERAFQVSIRHICTLECGVLPSLGMSKIWTYSRSITFISVPRNSGTLFHRARLYKWRTPCQVCNTPTFVMIIATNQIVLRLLSSGRFTMPPVPAAQVIPRVAYPACTVLLQTVYSGAACRRVRAYLSSGLSCGRRSGVELRGERQSYVGKLAGHWPKSAGVRMRW